MSRSAEIAKWVRTFTSLYGALFAIYELKLVDDTGPVLVWQNDDGRYMRFTLEVTAQTRLAEEPLELAGIWIGAGDHNTFSMYRVHDDKPFSRVDTALDFFEYARGVQDPTSYPNNRVSRSLRRIRFLPVVADELFTSDSIFAEIHAWTAATRGLPGTGRKLQADPLRRLRDTFIRNGVAAEVVDRWITEAS